ncbi:polynucleotide kinase-phosphatase [Methylosinus sp. KRF6]|uniref:polynucleotide kinase-phosphatase n=1 Tax=Methylosinus sp. KRF6 TaxID=2846853 RepID=UPI001C0DB0E3|nr:polynucleotide kinase-phosphatase [Methylosinus sp. KRF6]MBU3888757.1 polynucleotide kinase-phosphatase [Methylosinus sp. KRF6]
MNAPLPTLLDIPDFCLVVLIGATGAGKSSFASRWFKPTEVISSDHCRGLVCDDETDQSASADAFALVAAIAEKRLKNRRLAVIDATNVRAADRKSWVELARRWHALPVAIVVDPGLDVCIERNKARPDRDFGPGVPQRMIQEIHRGLRGLANEGFRQIWKLSSVAAIEAAVVERRPMWTDKRDDAGPFDVIGDVHGCLDELRRLLESLGYVVEGEGDAVAVSAPHGRKLVFVGDLVDRGPDVPGVLRLAMAAQEAGVAYVVQGNHDRKLSRWLEGRKVTVGHGLQESIDQLAQEPAEFRERVKTFLADLRSHYWLDGGKLAVAHAGLKEEMIGRGSPAVREFALFGETTGETDEFGLPVRLDWAANYRGRSAIVYGHTPTPDAEWVNNTICVDTGCVFGGKLTALRWPERGLVEVPAARVYCEPARPLAPAPETRALQAEADRLLDHADVSGRRWIDTTLLRRIPVAEENSAAALEAMSRFALAPQWLIYLPPTMSPVETSARDGFLERPEEAFAFFRERGQKEVVLEEKHMGSRAVVALCRDADVARRRFGVLSGESGQIWTRSGRAFFADGAECEALLARLRSACDSAGLWETLASDWLLFDTEIMPWSAKASALIEQQYAPVAAASHAGLALAHDAAARAAARGVPVEALRDRLASRAEKAARYGEAWKPYVWPVRSLDDLRIAPFHLLASEGATHFDKDHLWHMSIAETLAASGAQNVTTTRWRHVSLDDASACEAAMRWWEELTEAGGEGVVVKPRDFIARGAKGPIQPALKVRGPEYLRIIYGPEYDLPEHLTRLRQRGLGAKRTNALREFALGHEALTRFTAGAPLRKTHECVFAILALESEPIDPRL